MRSIRTTLVASVFVAALFGASFPAIAADPILNGTVKSAAGKAMGGVMVSAKPVGGTITTTVLTDASGHYYFPPLTPGKYRLLAKVLSFEIAKDEIDLGAAKTHDFTMQPMKDFFRQLPGNAMLAALPEDNDQDKRMKRIVRNECTACHTGSYVLQHRFDEAGWNAIIELMKNVNVGGTYVAANRAPNGLLDHFQKDLAHYLAKARGSGENHLKVKLERPAGESARVMFKEYDVPLDPDANLPANFVQNDGSDWSLGTPSVLIPGYGVHDAWLDLQGDLWFTCNIPNKRVTIGRISTKTGEVKLFPVPGQHGMMAQTHGMTRDANGILWFNVNPGRGGLGRMDPKTENLEVFIPPADMSPTGGATTVDYDGKGKIWASAPDGALRFDPVTEKFTGFKSITYKTPNGTGLTYGAAADRDGNGWWAEMTLDIIGKGNMATGKSEEVKLAPIKAEFDRVTPEAKKFLATYNQPDFNGPLPWAQGPRRMGTDKNADVLWVGNSWGSNLARINTKTNETTYVPLPNNQQPYHVAVDKEHRPWTNLWGADRVMRYDPKTSKWTAFDLPTRGAEPRYVSLLEQDGKPLQVVLPYFRTRKVAVMTLRTEADLKTLASEAAKQ